MKAPSLKLNNAKRYENMSFDVVIPTLFRKSLPYTIESIHKVIPNPNIILISDKGTTGEFRNKGLAKCTSEYCCFVDDDIILNRQWFELCMARLESDKELVVVAGRCREGNMETNGCLICRTKEFQELGGFPRMDVHVRLKLKSRMAEVPNAICEHVNMRGIAVLTHTLHSLGADFQTEAKWGVYESPGWSIKMMLTCMKKKNPDYAVSYLLWITKAVYVKAFALLERVVP